MAETEQNNNEEQQQDNVDYIAVINDLKANTVDRKAYQDLQKEHKRLLTAYVNGEKGAVPNEAPAVDVKALTKNIFGGKNNNIEYATKLLQVRAELIAQGQQDPFLPSGANSRIEDTDVIAANRVADVLQQCINESDGNNEVFTAKLMARTIESPIMNTNRHKK